MEKICIFCQHKFETLNGRARTCSDECQKSRRKQTSYAATKRMMVALPKTKPTGFCLHCSEPHQQTTNRHYCSSACRKTARRARIFSAPDHWSKKERPCRQCTKPFAPGPESSSMACYCSPECKAEGYRQRVKEFGDKNLGKLAAYRATARRKNGGRDTLQQRLYKKYPDLPRICETPTCCENRVLEASHKPGFERNGHHQTLKFYERHMFWMLCPTCHKVLDKKIETPEQMGLS